MPTLCQQLLHFCKCEHAMHVSGWNLTMNCFSQGAVFLSIALFLLSPTHCSEAYFAVSVRVDSTERAEKAYHSYL